MDTAIKIKICMGSSCYSRGNMRVKEVVDGFVKARNLEDKIDFRGDLCCGKCGEGPNITIGDKEYHNVDEELVWDILEETFGKKKSERMNTGSGVIKQ